MRNIIISLVILLTPTIVYSKSLTLEEISQSTARVSSNNGRGTATVIKKTIPFTYKGRNYPAGYFLQTNYHVVGNNNTVNIEFFRNGHISQPINAEVIWRRYNGNTSVDIALLWIPQSIFNNKNKPRVILLAPADYELKNGQVIRAVGCANGGWARGWTGHITDSYQSSGATEFFPKTIGGESGTGIVVDIPDKNGEMQTRVAILLAWSTQDRGAGLSNKLIHKIRLGQAISNGNLPDYYQKVITPLPSTRANKPIKLPNCGTCNHPFKQHIKRKGQYCCPHNGPCAGGSCNPFEWFGGGGGQEPPDNGGGQDPAPWPDPPGSEEEPIDPIPNDKIVELEAKMKELTEEYNHIKNDFDVSIIEKNKLIEDIVSLKELLDIEKNANGGLAQNLTDKSVENKALAERNEHLDENNKGLLGKLGLINENIKGKISIISRLKEKLIHPLDTITNGNGVWLERVSFLAFGGLIGILLILWNKSKVKLGQAVDKFTDNIPGKLDDIIIDRIIWPRIVRYIDERLGSNSDTQQDVKTGPASVPPPMVKPNTYKTVSVPEFPTGYGPVPPNHPLHKYEKHEILNAIDGIARQHPLETNLNSLPALLKNVLEAPFRGRKRDA